MSLEEEIEQAGKHIVDHAIDTLHANHEAVSQVSLEERVHVLLVEWGLPDDYVDQSLIKVSAENV
jgi:hypothetical protein